MKTGKIKNPKKIKTTIALDSKIRITRETLVINYKNDAKTRSFFEKEIGSHFHFNSYLRQFAKYINMDSKITCWHLVDKWINEELNKKILTIKELLVNSSNLINSKEIFMQLKKEKPAKNLYKRGN